MRRNYLQLIRTRPLFILLLPFFFVFHGFTTNYDTVPVGSAFILFLEYIGATMLLSFIFWFGFRNITKACFMAFVIMLYYLFFGNIKDLLTDIFSQSPVLHYRFLLPISFLVLVFIFTWLKKRKRTLFNFTSYLNILLIILVVVDIGLLVLKIPKVNKSRGFDPSKEGLFICDSCNKPDIYLIIPDQYTGTTALNEVFNFNNTNFENDLKARGFHIVRSSNSNYNLTPFSVASTLNMDYLSLKKGPQNFSTLSYSYKLIRNNHVLKFLLASGYKFYNYSIFDFDEQPAHKYSSFLPYGISLVTSQTLFSRLWEDFKEDVLDGRFRLNNLQKKLAYENLNFNDEMILLTERIAALQDHSPKFIYTHLMMPHYPYYFDSNGHLLPLEKFTNRKKTTASDYLEYLQYGNKKLLQLVDQILTASPSPPVIMLLSDHGFQHLQKDTPPKYDFMNLNAIYLPDKQYASFYDSMSNVNQFRVFFNVYFNQHLPLLKDSVSNIWSN